MTENPVFQSVNPATGAPGPRHPVHDAGEVERRLSASAAAFLKWRTTSHPERARLLVRAALLFSERTRVLADTVAREMGKPVTAGRAEAEKCARALDYYAEHAGRFLAPELVETEHAKSYIRFDPLGPILAVMPWNFPYWQVIRFAAPVLAAGNVVLLKHASQVQGAASALEELFRDAGFPEGTFLNMAIPSSGVEALLRDPRVKGVALTGSERAGVSVAAIAGSEVKTSVLELGGSDPFIVLADADLPAAAAAAAAARLQNTGQSCIAAKRFIVERAVSGRFTDLLAARFKAVRTGDPLDEETELGPLVSAVALDEVASQVERSTARGATLVCGGKRLIGPGFFYEPTILANVRPDTPAYHEETFGPIAAIIETDRGDAVKVANDSRFGLGASIWSTDTRRAEELAAELDAGVVAVNGVVKSDPRLPFGGVKKSGYGRELGRYGMLEFVNIKTVTVART